MEIHRWLLLYGEGGTVGSPPSHEEAAMITMRTNSYMKSTQHPAMSLDGVYVVWGGEGCSASDDDGECARGRVVK